MASCKDGRACVLICLLTCLQSSFAVRTVLTKSTFYENAQVELDLEPCGVDKYKKQWGNRFTVQKKLGEGASGCVVLATNNEDGGVKVAIKTTKKAGEGKLAKWTAECELTKKLHQLACKKSDEWKRLSERFLPNCLEVGGDDNAAFLIMHAAGGQGLGHRSDVLQYNREDRLSLFAQLVGAMASMHGIGYAHNDLHSNNLDMMKKEPPTLVLIDFGSTKPLMKSHYRDGYKEDENVIMIRAKQFGNCNENAEKAEVLTCLREKWGPDGADDEFFNVLSKVFDEAEKHEKHKPIQVPLLYKTAFIQKLLNPMETLFPNNECGTGSTVSPGPVRDPPKKPTVPTEVQPTGDYATCPSRVSHYCRKQMEAGGVACVKAADDPVAHGTDVQCVNSEKAAGYDCPASLPVKCQ